MKKTPAQRKAWNAYESACAKEQRLEKAAKASFFATAGNTPDVFRKKMAAWTEAHIATCQAAEAYDQAMVNG